MNGLDLRAVREYLGLDAMWLAAMLGLPPGVLRGLEAEVDQMVPPEIEEAVTRMARDTAERVRQVVASMEPGGVLHIPAESRPDSQWPPRWWRHLAARVAAEVPGLQIAYHDGQASDEPGLRFWTDDE